MRPPPPSLMSKDPGVEMDYAPLWWKTFNVLMTTGAALLPLIMILTGSI